MSFAWGDGDFNKRSALTPLFFTISDTFLLPCCCNFQTPQKVIDGCHHCIVTESMSLANHQVIEGPTNPKKLWRHKKCHWHSKFNFYAFLKRRRSLIVSLLFCQTTFWGSRETPAPHVILWSFRDIPPPKKNKYQRQDWVKRNANYPPLAHPPFRRLCLPKIKLYYNLVSLHLLTISASQSHISYNPCPLSEFQKPCSHFPRIRSISGKASLTFSEKKTTILK